MVPGDLLRALDGLPDGGVGTREGLAGSDGIVSVEMVHLWGARQITFADVRHGRIGAPWHGEAETIDRGPPTL